MPARCDLLAPKSVYTQGRFQQPGRFDWQPRQETQGHRRGNHSPSFGDIVAAGRCNGRALDADVTHLGLLTSSDRHWMDVTSPFKPLPNTEPLDADGLTTASERETQRRRVRLEKGTSPFDGRERTSCASPGPPGVVCAGPQPPAHVEGRFGGERKLPIRLRRLVSPLPYFRSPPLWSA